MLYCYCPPPAPPKDLPQPALPQALLSSALTCAGMAALLPGHHRLLCKLLHLLSCLSQVPTLPSRCHPVCVGGWGGSWP